MIANHSYKIVTLFYLAVALLMPGAQAEESKRTPQFTEEGTQSCLVCHSGERINAIRAGIHGETNPLAEHGCEDCHGPGSFHVSRAHGGKGFPLMIAFGKGSDASPRDDQVGACLGCHANEAGSKEAIAFLGSVHDKPFVTCSACHSVHGDMDRITDKEQQAATCHGCHAKAKAEHSRFEDKSIDFDALKCSTCHDAHRLVSEGQ